MHETGSSSRKFLSMSNRSKGIDFVPREEVKAYARVFNMHATGSNGTAARPCVCVSVHGRDIRLITLLCKCSGNVYKSVAFHKTFRTQIKSAVNTMSANQRKANIFIFQIELGYLSSGVFIFVLYMNYLSTEFGIYNLFIN